MQSLCAEKFVRGDLQAHIYSDALLANLSQLKGLCAPDVKFCAVVKANAYGHGFAQVTGILKDADVDFFAVANLFEALYIMPLIGPQSILILQPVHTAQPAESIITAAQNKFHCTVCSLASAEYISSVLAGTNLTLNLHVNVETGMGRYGLDPAQAAKLIEMIDRSDNMLLAGVYTHFATADEDDLSYVLQQLAAFNDFLAATGLDARGDVIKHAANSAATIKLPQTHFNMVRCGIALYGYFSRQGSYPMPQSRESRPVKLTPVMKLTAPVVRLKNVAAGASISYGRSFTAPRPMTIGVVSLGYADGYRRCFSNRAKMKLGDTEVPVIGRVCMDQLLIDVTGLDNVKVGQRVTVIDNSHDFCCGAYTLAQLADTICYEILTCVHGHVNRTVH